jgi:hypothetical protein
VQHAEIVKYNLPDTCSIERRADDTWSICDHPLVYNFKKHRWVYEPLPSSRNDRFIFETRFSSPEDAYATWERLTCLEDFDHRT